MKIRDFLPAGAAVIALAITVAPACAERVRYHFSPADLCGSTVQTPAGPGGTVGARVSYFGLGTEPYSCVMKPNFLVTFRHPYTSKSVVVPLALPQDTPRIDHARDKVIFNYGTYTVTVHFLPDGSAEAIYDSGLGRPLVNPK